MTISKSSLTSIPTCYATVSIGTPTTPLNQKLAAIAGAGFQGIELGFPDLLSYASQTYKKDVDAQDFDTLCDAGRKVATMCQEAELKIIMLQPFSNFEGWPEESEGREDAFRRAKGWIRIMQAVGTDMLQVSSSPNLNTTHTQKPRHSNNLTDHRQLGRLNRLPSRPLLNLLPRLRPPPTLRSPLPT